MESSAQEWFDSDEAEFQMRNGGEELDGFVASGTSGAGDSDGADESGRSDGWAVLLLNTRFINVCEWVVMWNFAFDF